MTDIYQGSLWVGTHADEPVCGDDGRPLLPSPLFVSISVLIRCVQPFRTIRLESILVFEPFQFDTTSLITAKEERDLATSSMTSISTHTHAHIYTHTHIHTHSKKEQAQTCRCHPLWRLDQFRQHLSLLKCYLCKGCIRVQVWGGSSP